MLEFIGGISSTIADPQPASVAPCGVVVADLTDSTSSTDRYRDKSHSALGDMGLYAGI
jgi:hypothetical protein